MEKHIQQLCDQLSHSTSRKRRSAAKQLRKLKAVESGTLLEDALSKEINDSRTWETQYQMIMAIGEMEYKPALALLYRISELQLKNTMVLTACGDSIVRLSSAEAALPNWIMRDQYHLIGGAIRAIAMLHYVPDCKLANDIIGYVSKNKNADLKFWVAAAAAGWSGAAVNSFLIECLNDQLEDTQKAAKASLDKKYLTWNPL